MHCRRSPRDASNHGRCSFFQETDNGALAGVFDGHRGRNVADYACNEVKEKFNAYLAEASGNVHLAFEKLIHDIQIHIKEKHRVWDDQGCVAVICFIDKLMHRIYTATIGDCEANIYRENREKNLKSIPLSCLRDWNCKGEAERAAAAKQDSSFVAGWIGSRKPKTLRFSYDGMHGCNFSRALGDNGINERWPIPPITHKPKITVTLLRPNDLVALASDGVKSFMSESKIVDNLTNIQKSAANVAESLVKLAIDSKSQDNVSVIAIKIV